ncbi:two component transcriptional regulator, LuxR family [Actinokineospora alba]|uniref:Two component transcriptional regulator, LuxR family n=1 Tax=Actinokineospora alba TaxID=504798 RepID=A0A1H0R4F8_9PSEU|nr:response regulator transcription factor [Actinokineospora alba]TDP70254.1 LuxR family two component transcriptional regulator [Actinokineospora alba]SDI35692.1 two-component system, NarL family, response regulator DesR [Actinokineospora alba]SDP24401.1 two component transcriptional regulator, LuxR family [Actinokineospora alba]
MIRVVLADDEDLIRGALAALLELEPDITVVAEVSDGDAAVAAVERLSPDIAVLDLEMPRRDGVAAAEAIGHRAAVVIVTRHARPGVLKRALAAGVRGFVPKTTPASRLATILRDVHAGGRYVDSEIAASALTEDTCPLTARELEVLRHTRRGGSVQDIARTVHLAHGTVRNYLSSAMAKLGVSSRHDAARMAWDEGWI